MLTLFVLAIPPTRIIMEAYDMRIIIYRSFRKIFGALKYSAMARRCVAAPTMPVSIKASCQSGLRKYATAATTTPNIMAAAETWMTSSRRTFVWKML